jgi:phosphoglycolate phosphatase-like HAD superfamily hydrolase
MALATLNSELSVKHFMNTSGIPANTFNPAVNRDSLGGIMKPDPQVATSILNAWDVKTLTDADTTAGASVGNYWFIGDSLDDMKCGHLAGCKTCLIRTSFNKQVELDQAGTGVITVVVDTLTEWLEHVSL